MTEAFWPDVDRDYPLAQYRGATPPSPEWFDNALAQTPQRGRVAVDGAGIEWLAWGERGAPGVILLHGAMAHAEWWSHVAPLIAQGRRVVAPSWSGMGGSDWRDAYSVASHAREAVAVAEAAGLFEASTAPLVVAHSFGGHAALRLAADHGERFSGIVILDSAAGARAHPPRHRLKAAAYASIEDALARFRLLPGQAAEPFILDRIGRTGLTTTADNDGAILYRWRFDPGLFDKYEPFDDHDALTACRCPLTFVRGELSAVCTPDTEAGQRAAAPSGARFHTVQGAAHHLMADQPMRLVDTLRALLAGDQVQTRVSGDGPTPAGDLSAFLSSSTGTAP